MDVIETERLRLERWNETHRADFERMCNDPIVMRFIGDGAPWSSERAATVFAQKLHMWDERDFGWRAARSRSDGTWVGIIALQPMGEAAVGAPEGLDPEAVEIGWWIDAALWGQGYATEGALALRDEAFDRVGVDRLLARLQPENGASAAVAEKIGLRYDCSARGASGEDLAIYVLERPA